MNTRYWTIDVKPPPNYRPYGSSTVGVMDEVEGSVIFYCNELSAERIISGLILLEDTNRGN